MATLYTQADSNIRKTWMFLFFFLVLIVGVGWAVSYVMGNVSILYIAVILSILMNFGSYWYSDKLVLKMNHAKPIEKSDSPELYRLVENLCITAGLPLPKIYIIESEQPNAFATGRNAEHAVVAVTTGLLNKLERAELEGVIAHELSHIGNKDMLLQTIIVALVGTIVILSDFFFRMAFWGGLGGKNNDNNKSGGQAQIIMMVIAVALIILAPIMAQIIKFAISRKREYLADASGALLTRYPEGLARALEKISADQNPIRGAGDSNAHLYISNPFKGKEQTSFIHKLFMTHPKVEERTKALRGMKM